MPDTLNPDAPPATHAEPADELALSLAEARKELDALKAALDAAERRRAIERALLEADAIDLETASLLTESAVAGAPAPGAAIAGAVADLKRRKPFLFARRAPRSATMAPRGAPASDPLALSREHAAATGDRASLLRYLRLRRTA